MTLVQMADALRAAGFVGIELQGAVIFARTGPAAPEFQARFDATWTLCLTCPVRAPQAALLAWNAAHPQALLDIDQGETRLRMALDPAAPGALGEWAAQADEVTARALLWRRSQRARGEGM